MGEVSDNCRGTSTDPRVRVGIVAIVAIVGVGGVGGLCILERTGIGQGWRGSHVMIVLMVQARMLIQQSHAFMMIQRHVQQEVEVTRLNTSVEKEELSELILMLLLMHG